MTNQILGNQIAGTPCQVQSKIKMCFMIGKIKDIIWGVSLENPFLKRHLILMCVQK